MSIRVRVMKSVMKTVSVWLLVFSALFLSLHTGGAATVVAIPVQVVPQGISSVNGSDVNMGCASPPAGIGDVMLCGTPLADIDNATCGTGSESYMVDCNSPAIDTSTSNWASQLVTVRKNDAIDDIPFDHVVLTFYFDTAVSPTAIELDLFLCPEWNIGAPYISVYADESNDTCGLVFNYRSAQEGDIDFLVNYTPKGTSCDSLTNVSIPVQEAIRDSSYFTWHIVVSFAPQLDIEWVYVGEVRFVDVPAACPNPSASVEIPDTTRESTSNLVTPFTSLSLSSTLIPMMSTKHSTTLVHSTSLRNTSTPQLQPTSVPGSRDIDCTCSEHISAMVAVSAVSLLLIVTLTTVILTQCLLIVRMRKSKDVLHRNEIYAEVMTPTTMHTDVPVSPNEAYGLHKMTSSSEEVTYELVK